MKITEKTVKGVKFVLFRLGRLASKNYLGIWRMQVEFFLKGSNWLIEWSLSHDSYNNVCEIVMKWIEGHVEREELVLDSALDVSYLV